MIFVLSIVELVTEHHCYVATMQIQVRVADGLVRLVTRIGEPVVEPKAIWEEVVEAEEER